ncbi:MAG TPA: SDR family NAD(P)-dependent oxidoreductase [Planctomycetaceae bacterium]|nr:SDR family NAD(P)-dependent oxidoreductase [Planctomycetaceae bacterium]
MKRLAGRTAIVTGASAGIGLHVARALAREQMNLVLAARSADTLHGLAAELEQTGVDVLAVPTDVACVSALDRLVERAIGRFGGIDVLVNNAGVEAWRVFHELPVEEIERTIQVNLTAAVVLSRLVVPWMLRSGGGHVVNMSSTAGKQGPAYGAVYGATKAGLIALTQSLRAEYHGSGVSSSVICPGFTDEGGIYERIKRSSGRGTPPWMGRTSADAVARAVVRAIRRDRPDVIVNVPPMRPVFALAELFPSLGGWMVRLATRRFLRRAAKGSPEATQTRRRRAA